MVDFHITAIPMNLRVCDSSLARAIYIDKISSTATTARRTVVVFARRSCACLRRRTQTAIHKEGDGCSSSDDDKNNQKESFLHGAVNTCPWSTIEDRHRSGFARKPT